MSPRGALGQSDSSSIRAHVPALARANLGSSPVLFVVILLTLATVAIAAVHMAPRMAAGRIIFAVEADRPAGFGYRMTWLAIRTRDAAAVVDSSA